MITPGVAVSLLRGSSCRPRLSGCARVTRGPEAPAPRRGILAAGNNGDMADDLRAFAAAPRSHRNAGLKLDADVLDAEAHNSVFPRALLNGLRFVFEGR